MVLRHGEQRTVDLSWRGREWGGTATASAAKLSPISSLMEPNLITLSLSLSACRYGTHLSVGGAGHVDAVDLDDLVAGLQPPVLRDQPLRVHLLHHHASLKGKKERRDLDTNWP